MALIGELTEAELAELTARVAARMGAESTSISPPAGSALMEIVGASVQFILDVAPRCPEAIGREAMIRLGGWLADNRPHVSEHEISDPSGTSIRLKFSNSAATANGFRHSGASALVSRFVMRRGGVIS